MRKNTSRFNYLHPLIPYAVEFDALGQLEVSPEDKKKLTDLYWAMKEGAAWVVQPLKSLVQKYPKVPQIKNHLYTAYVQLRKRKLAKQLLCEIREQHPDYLFGLANAALELLQSDKDAIATHRLLGDALLLQDLYPTREVFHVSEVMIYYHSAVLLLLEEENIKAAKERNGILMAIDRDHPTVNQLIKRIALKEMEIGMKRMQKIQRDKRLVQSRNTAP